MRVGFKAPPAGHGWRRRGVKERMTGNDGEGCGANRNLRTLMEKIGKERRLMGNIEDP
jgi:hypothetical protein